jgi:hypothetical protein
MAQGDAKDIGLFRSDSGECWSFRSG